MEAHYLINMENCMIVPRNKWTDKQVNLKPISDRVVEMIMNHEVEAKEVVNVIGARLRDDPDFDFKEYDKALRLLNVRQANKQEAPIRDVLADRSDEVLGEDELVAEKEKATRAAKAKEEKKARVRKIGAELNGLPLN